MTLSLASIQEMEPISSDCSDSLHTLIVETADKLTFTLESVDNACIDSSYFIGHIYTPVCEDEICYPIVLDIKWDLLGYFKDYEMPADSPLTKFDHQPISDRDHFKMRKILSNKYSVLRNMKVADLIDEHAMVKSTINLDGVTGATKTSLKTEVVGGAVYSTYTLWHIVNGAAADSIRKRTESKFDSALLREFLRSSNPHYHFFALEKIPADHEEQFKDDIIRLIQQGEGNVPFFAFDRLPPQIWTDSVYQNRFVAMLESLDFKLKNAVLNQLIDVSISETSLHTLTTQLGRLTTQQQSKALTVIERNAARMTPCAAACLTLFQARIESGEVFERTTQVLTQWQHGLQGIKLKN